MKKLEKRIIAARGGWLIGVLDDAWGTTEGSSPSECVLERSMLKGSAWLLMLIGAAFSIAVCPVLIVSIEQGVPFSWLTRVIIGLLVLVSSTFLSWLLCWPHPSRNPCWRTAVDFAEAIGFAEEAMGQPFEEWKDLEEVTARVRDALARDLQDIDPEATEIYELSVYIVFYKWSRLHALMVRLLPDLSGLRSDYLLKDSAVEGGS